MHDEMERRVQLEKKSVSTITAFSESTAKDLLSIQKNHMLNQLNSVMLRCRALSQIENCKGTIDNQLKYFEGVSDELSEITGQEIHFLTFYKTKIIDLVEKNITVAPLISVSYRVTEGKKISVVNVQKDNTHHPHFQSRL